MRYDVVFVDWDLTLSGSRFWGQWACDPKFAHAYGLIQRKLFASSPDVLDGWMRGKYCAEDVVAEVARRTGLRPEDLVDGLRDSCKGMTLYDDAVLTSVDALRSRGLKVVIATDNMDTFTRWTVPALGLELHFDEILNSYGLMARKKDKQINGGSSFFAGYFERQKVDPARAVLIDDSASNRVVEDFGMSFVKIGDDISVVSALDAIAR